MPTGHQDYWVAGARYYFQRDPISGLEQPVIDFGTIQPVSPALTLEKIELEDSDGGIKSTVDEKVPKIDETYDVTCNNMNLENWSILMLGEAPSDYNQTTTQRSVIHFAHPGRLVKLKDTDGSMIYNMQAISGIVTGGIANTSTAVLTDISSSGKTLETGTDISTHLQAGDAVIVESTGLANVKNSRTYTVASVNTTTITVEETPTADESSITGVLRYVATTDTGVILLQGSESGVDDWSVYNLERGLVRLSPNSPNFTVAGNVNIIYTPASLTGKRLVLPQSARGEIKGTGMLIWGRSNFAEQTVREGRMSITPNSANVQVDDYSNMVFTLKFLSDLTASQPAGRMLQFIGDLPTLS